MPIETKKFLVCVLLFTILFCLIFLGFFHKKTVGYALFAEFVLLLPLVLLYAKDSNIAIDDLESENYSVKTLYWLGKLPILIMSLFAIIIGASLQIWIIFNLFIERQESFTGDWFSILGGIGFLLYGVTTMKYLVSGSKR